MVKTIRVLEKLYIQTLIIGGMTPQMVIDELTRLSLPIPTNEMPEIVDELRAAVPRFFSHKEIPDEAIMEELGLAPMYYYRFNKFYSKSIDGCASALEMLQDPQIRKFVLALSMAGISLTDVELLINGRYSMNWESPDFQMYAKYFCNLENWTFADKDFFIEQKVKDQGLRQLLKNSALKGDRHYLVWKLGLGTDPQMSMEQIFTDMAGDAYFTFKENLKINLDTAQKFATLAIRLSDRLDQNDNKKREVSSFKDELVIKLAVEKSSPNSESVIDKSEIELDIPQVQSAKINLKEVKFE
jgi:hypothetical protein